MTPEEVVKRIIKMPHWAFCMCEQCLLRDVLRRERRKLAKRYVRRSSTRSKA